MKRKEIKHHEYLQISEIIINKDKKKKSKTSLLRRKVQKNDEQRAGGCTELKNKLKLPLISTFKIKSEITS